MYEHLAPPQLSDSPGAGASTTSASSGDAYDYDEQVAHAQAVFDTLITQASPRYTEARTLRDVLLTATRPGPCRQGSKVQISNRKTGKIMHRRNPCGKWNCPRCAPPKPMLAIRETLREWNGAPVFARVFAALEGEWKDVQDARRLMKMYPAQFCRIVGESGASVVFTPGAFEGGVLVPEPGAALAEAFLDVLAPGKARRYTKPQPTNASEPRDPSTTFYLRLPFRLSLQEANKTAEELLGRSLQWSHSDDEQAFIAAGLEPEEVDRLHERFAALVKEAREEKALLDATVRLFDTGLLLLTLAGCSATPKEYALAAGCSPSTALTRLKTLYERGSLVKTKEGRMLRYTLRADAGGHVE